MNRKQRKRLVKLFRQGLFRADMLVPGAKVLIQHYRIDEAHTCRKPVSFRFKKSGPNKSQWIPSTRMGRLIALSSYRDPIDSILERGVILRLEERRDATLIWMGIIVESGRILRSDGR